MAYYKLEVWKKAQKLGAEVERLTKSLPKKEQFGLVDQMLRSSESISSNISEGNGRNTTKDYRHFLSNARGSDLEVQSQLRLCVGRGYLTDADIRKAMNMSISIYKMLSKMMESLKEKEEREMLEREAEKRRKKAQPSLESMYVLAVKYYLITNFREYGTRYFASQ